MKVQSVVLPGLMLVSGLAGASEAQCRQNYTQTGSFFAGRVFSSWYEWPDVPTGEAYRRYYALTAKGGLKIVQADREMGVITAEQATVGGDGSAATLDFSTVIEPSGKGSRITATIKSPPGKAMGRDAVINAICGEA